MKPWMVIIVVLAVVAIGGMLGFMFFFRDDIEQNRARQGSAAVDIKGTITVCDDDYLGYATTHTIEFRNNLQDRGYNLEFVADGEEVDYDIRNAKFANGECDIMMIPIGTYWYHGSKYGYPGVIPVVFTESVDADAVVAYKTDLIGSEDRPVTINDLNNPSLRICVTPDSPSSFLLEAAITNFQLDALRGSTAWRIDTNGSIDAFERFKNKQCNVAVLWEPQVSRALALEGAIQVYGSSEIAGTIIDVPVVHRNSENHREEQEKLDAFFATHFDALKFFANPRNEDVMVKNLKRVADFDSDEELLNALGKVRWYDLQDNCEDWFSIGPGITQGQRDRIRDAIDLIVDVSLDVGKLQEDPLHGDYLKIINRDILGRFCTGSYVQGGFGADVDLNYVFTELSDEEWRTLKPIGQIDFPPIVFETGSTTKVTLQGTEEVQKAATRLDVNFGQARILVKGHTAQVYGDEAKAQAVARSQERAELVRQKLIAEYGIQPERIWAVGVGDTELPKREPKERELTYVKRSERVEICVLQDIELRLGG